MTLGVPVCASIMGEKNPAEGTSLPDENEIEVGRGIPDPGLNNFWVDDSINSPR